PLVEGAAEALRDGYVSGGTRRNLDWVSARVEADSGITQDDLLLLADAQTSGGLLVVGELPGHPVIGYTTDRSDVIEVRKPTVEIESSKIPWARRASRRARCGSTTCRGSLVES